jgi:beta-glucosidase
VDAGCAGFILFGGTVGGARTLIEGLRTRAARPLLFGADLERGAGQQFEGATALPPLGAFGALDDPGATRAAGELTALEARSIGVDILFAPVADVAAEPDNPIVGPRAVGADPEVVARHVVAWIEGARAGGALPCVKHFPGHGRTTGDTHLEEVRVEADAATLRADLHPFRAAIAAGVPLLMPGHLAAPSLDPSGSIATVSERLLRELLRRELGFDGVVVTDALLMGGAGALRRTAVEAVRAGVDLLLYPEDPEVAVEALLEGCAADPALADRLTDAAGRVRALAGVAAAEPRAGAPGVDASPEARARAWAQAAVVRVRGDGSAPGPETPIRVVHVDDDVGGPWPVPPRTLFEAALGEAALGEGAAGVDGRPARTVIALWADTRGWKGRAGLSEHARAALAAALADTPDADIVVFGGPRVVDDVPAGPRVWLAWGGEPRMQRAAAAVLRSGAPGPAPGTPERAPGPDGA